MKDASNAADTVAPVMTAEAHTPSLLRTTMLVLPALVVFRTGELALPLVLAFWFGRAPAMDVYFFAWAVFSFAGSLVFSAFKDSPLVPVLAEARIAHPHTIPRLLGTVLMHTWAIGGALAALVGLTALGWFALRYRGAEFTLAASMVVPLTLFLVVMATRTFFSALLTVERHFVVQQVASGLGMGVNLAMIALGHARFGIFLVPCGALAGELAALGLLAWFALRIVGVNVALNVERPQALKRIARLIAHEVGGGAVTRVNPVVDQLMAGLSGVVGAGTMLRLSGDVALVPTSLLQAALLPVLLSQLSEDFAKRDFMRFRRTVVRTLGTVTLLLLGAAGAMTLFREPLIRFVFLRGAMDAGGASRMAHLMPFHLVGLAPFGALLVLARAHVALENSRIMIGMGLLNAGANVALNVLFLRLFGLEGLALSTSCVHLAIAVVFWFQFEACLRERTRERPRDGQGSAARITSAS